MLMFFYLEKKSNKLHVSSFYAKIESFFPSKLRRSIDQMMYLSNDRQKSSLDINDEKLLSR